jgi:hypothetical protein
MEGTVPINLRNMEGTPPPTGACPTQPYKCGQNVKIKTPALVLIQNRSEWVPVL